MIRMTWAQYKRKRCTYRGREVRLSANEAEILMVLLVRRGSLVSYLELLELIYPHPDFEPDSAVNCIRVFMTHLNAKIPGVLERRRQGSRGVMIPLPTDEPVEATELRWAA